MRIGGCVLEPGKRSRHIAKPAPSTGAVIRRLMPMACDGHSGLRKETSANSSILRCSLGKDSIYGLSIIYVINPCIMAIGIKTDGMTGLMGQQRLLHTGR